METENSVIQCSHCGQKVRLDIEKARQGIHTVKCGSCGDSLFPDKYTTLPGLKPEDYQHPLDRQARRTLSRMPGIETILKRILQEGLVKYQHLLLRQNAILVHDKHLPRYQQMLKNGAQVLGLSELPDLYIQQSPMPNAYTFGAKKHVVVLTSSLIDLLDDDEIETVIAHELGHVHCDHVLYKTAARILTSLAVEVAARMFGLASSVIYPLIYALLYWDRASELSADRAELLVNRDYRASISTLLKISGGSRKVNEELDIDQFLEQARSTQELKEKNLLDKIYLIIQESNSTHHFPLWRAQKIEEWTKEKEYYQILGGQNITEKPDSSFSKQEEQAKDNSENGKNNDEESSISWKDIGNDFRDLFGFGEKRS